MNALEAEIRAEIEEKGPLPVERFMKLALMHPRYGYYRRRDPLGRAGDFITAPEISQMFGEMIGLCLADAWQSAGRPSPFTLLELGPGRGTLMADALRATQRIAGFHDALRLFLLEGNETLRARQGEVLAAFKPRFIEEVGALPADPLFVVANEFFDALPIRQFVREGGLWRERLVGVDDRDRLAFTLSSPVPFELPPLSRTVPGFAFAELSFSALTLFRDLAGRIARQGGAALVIDYGSGDPLGASTLQAVSGHKMVDPLERPGEVDLSAHVDFGALAGCAAERSLAVMPLMHQGAFLKNMGIELRADVLKSKASAAQISEIETALLRLTDPLEMGDLFKVLGVIPSESQPMAGFL